MTRRAHLNVLSLVRSMEVRAMVLWMTHLCATLLLVGLIWTIQLVHYPLFALVGESGWSGYHVAHTRQISALVMPLMVVELGSAALLVMQPPARVSVGVMALGLALVIAIWAVTALWSVPAHAALAARFDEGALRALLWSNWARTLLWSARGALLVWVMAPWLRSALSDAPTP